jgi:hypothetical protein
MSDAQWSLLVGILIVAATRAIDIFLPKGYMARWVNKYLVKKPDDDDDGQAEEE